ncbi:MAG: hypothetical protein ABSE70_00770 [Candidatus Limnocylindrales bacterium]
MTRTKTTAVFNTTGAVKTVLAVAVVVVGLVVTADRIVATSTGGSDIEVGAGGANNSKVSQPVQTATVITADDRPDVFNRAAAARDALGFPVGARRTGKHVRDSYRPTDYDEVEEVDGAGQTLALTQFDPAGRLISAVRFDLPSASSPKVGMDAATKSATRGISASGVAVAGQYRADANPVLDGWDVHWDRSQDGYKVRGDETRVHVWPDGRIQSVAHVEHQLAAAPGQCLGIDDAKKVVTGQFDRWFAGRGSGYEVQQMNLEWVAPNAAFDAAKLSAPPAPYRLAWVANVKPSGVAADYVSLVTLYVDAGDGTVLGGDVVE